MGLLDSEAGGFPEDAAVGHHEVVAAGHRALRQKCQRARFLRRAFADIGYDGVATVELRGGDLDYLRDVSKRFDRILEGE